MARYRAGRFPGRFQVKRDETGDFGGPVVFLGACPVGGGGKDIREGWVELRQFREDIHADAVALEIHIGVGGVFAPGDAAGGEPLTNFVAANGE